jgi:hypothetical protein
MVALSGLVWCRRQPKEIFYFCKFVFSLKEFKGLSKDILTTQYNILGSQLQLIENVFDRFPLSVFLELWAFSTTHHQGDTHHVPR